MGFLDRILSAFQQQAYTGTLPEMNPSDWTPWPEIQGGYHKVLDFFNAPKQAVDIGTGIATDQLPMLGVDPSKGNEAGQLLWKYGIGPQLGAYPKELYEATGIESPESPNWIKPLEAARDTLGEGVSGILTDPLTIAGGAKGVRALSELGGLFAPAMLESGIHGLETVGKEGWTEEGGKGLGEAALGFGGLGLVGHGLAKGHGESLIPDRIGTEGLFDDLIPKVKVTEPNIKGIDFENMEKLQDLIDNPIKEHYNPLEDTKATSELTPLQKMFDESLIEDELASIERARKQGYIPSVEEHLRKLDEDFMSDPERGAFNLEALLGKKKAKKSEPVDLDEIDSLEMDYVDKLDLEPDVLPAKETKPILAFDTSGLPVVPKDMIAIHFWWPKDTPLDPVRNLFEDPRGRTKLDKKGREHKLVYDYQPREEPNYLNMKNPERGALNLDAFSKKSNSPIPEFDLSNIPKGVKSKKTFKPEQVHDFADWVNSLRAKDIEGELVSKKFSDLKELGVQGALDYQADPTSNPRFKDVSDYLNSKYKEVTNSGKKFGWKDRYLTQQWEEDPAIVSTALRLAQKGKDPSVIKAALEAFKNGDESVPGAKEFGEILSGRRLGLKPSFTMKSHIQDWATGIKLGLTPKLKSIPEVLGHYERAANKAIADQKFFNYLRQNGWVSTKEHSGWQVLSPEYFPHIRGGRKSGDKVYYAPKEIQELVQGYLQDPHKGGQLSRNVARLADVSSTTKDIALTGGMLPGTALNWHGLANILPAYSLTGPKNLVTNFAKGLTMVTNPNKARRMFEASESTAPFAIKKGGLTLFTEDRAWQDLSKGFFERVAQAEPVLGSKKLGRMTKAAKIMFDEPLFQKVIPAMKLEVFNDLYEKFSQKFEPDIAAQKAGEFTNTAFGGINWEAAGRDRSWQNFWRATILAPDWAESNLKLGIGTGKNLFKNTPEGQAYRKLMGNFAIAYLSTNILQKVLTNQWSFENPSSQVLSAKLGEVGEGDEKQEAYLRPFGTRMEMIRLPYQVAAAMLRGNYGEAFRVVKNRLSMPLRAGSNLMFQEDWRGKPLSGEGIPPGQQVLNQFEEIGSSLAPPYAVPIADLGKDIAEAAGYPPEDYGFSPGNPWYETLTQSTESPVIFNKPHQEDDMRLENLNIFNLEKKKKKRKNQVFVGI